MIGPTWNDTATRAREIEVRDVLKGAEVFECPFCGVNGAVGLLAKVTGHRCDCGALFYTKRTVAAHFKERDE